MDQVEKAALYWFKSVEGLGVRHIKSLRTGFGSLDKAYHGENMQWQELGLPEGLIARMVQRRLDEPADRIYERLQANGIDLIGVDDKSYPPDLENIKGRPYAIFIKGQRAVLDNPRVAVVGARKATGYGRSVAERLGKDLSDIGVTVVSGMALGIDSEAHKGALKGKSSTIAVLGSGPDVIYPSENRILYRQITELGLVISEYLPGTPSTPVHFPARNRIISGLSLGVVVVEAEERSGALITADFALEQGREVFAVPGPISSVTSRGPHNLIKQGAKLICGIDDILEELQARLEPINKKHPGKPDTTQLCLDFSQMDLDANQKKVIEWLEVEGKNVDELLALSGWDFGLLSTVLLQMEINGLVKSKPGNYYIMSMIH